MLLLKVHLSVNEVWPLEAIMYIADPSSAVLDSNVESLISKCAFFSANTTPPLSAVLFVAVTLFKTNFEVFPDI